MTRQVTREGTNDAGAQGGRFVIEGTVMVVPAAVLAAVLAVRAWRERLPTARLALELVVVLHLAGVVALALFPLPVDAAVIAARGALDIQENNLIPLVHLLAFAGGDTRIWDATQLIGNLLVLAPAAIWLPLLSTRVRTAGRVIAAGLAMSLAIELSQLAVSTVLGYTYRVADVDDVIVNTTGVALAYLGFRVVERLLDADWAPSVRKQAG
jgi:glycopeptide antibiotics resistance protein